MSTKAICKLCGEPMPEGEEMFYYHGYSGTCPKPPLPAVIASTAKEIASQTARFLFQGNSNEPFDENDTADIIEKALEQYAKQLEGR